MTEPPLVGCHAQAEGAGMSGALNLILTQARYMAALALGHATRTSSLDAARK